MAVKKERACGEAGCTHKPMTEAGLQWHMANMHKVAPAKAAAKVSDAASEAKVVADTLAQAFAPMFAAQTAALLAALRPVRVQKPKASAPAANPSVTA